MSLQDVVEYYDECHGDYKRIWGSERNFSFHYGFYRPHIRDSDQAADETNRELAGRAALRPGDHVLDAGCGIGGTAIWMAEQLGVRSVGLNVQPMQLRMGERIVRERGLHGRVRLQHGDFQRMPFHDASFDAVLIVEAACHAQDKAAVLRECARVLRPGGRLVLAEYLLLRRPRTAGEERMRRAWLEGWAIPHLFEAATLPGELERAGFCAVELEDTTARVLPDARRMFRASILSAPVTSYREWRGRRSRLERRNRLAARHQYRLLRRGIHAYGVVTARRADAAPA